MASVLGGYWFTYNDWLHGPFARLSYQEIHVKAFSENGSDSTALSYGEQERTSLVTSLGWQVAGRIGNARPFARVTWELESKDDDRSVSASSVTLGGNYSVPVHQARQQLPAIPGGRQRRFRPRDRLHHGLGHVGAQRWERLRRDGGRSRAAVTAATPRAQSARRGFLGALTNSRSNSGRGSRRSARPATAICHGST